MLMPWARGVFELILHGEMHLRAGEDFDRRMTLISFDNAIEVAIGTYLNLNPIQRRDREYRRNEVEYWLKNFHNRLEFLESECTCREVAMEYTRAEIVWYHEIRNHQYHTGPPASPNLEDLLNLRRACLWVFSFLFEVDEVESLLDERLAAMEPPRQVIERDPDTDSFLDEYYGDIEIGGLQFKPSDLLFSHDPKAYRELGLAIAPLAFPARSA